MCSALAAKRYDPGPADGVMGGRTGAAIASSHARPRLVVRLTASPLFVRTMQTARSHRVRRSRSNRIERPSGTVGSVEPTPTRTVAHRVASNRCRSRRDHAQHAILRTGSPPIHAPPPASASSSSMLTGRASARGSCVVPGSATVSSCRPGGIRLRPTATSAQIHPCRLAACPPYRRAAPRTRSIARPLWMSPLLNPGTMREGRGAPCRRMAAYRHCDGTA